MSAERYPAWNGVLCRSYTDDNGTGNYKYSISFDMTKQIIIRMTIDNTYRYEYGIPTAVTDGWHGLNTYDGIDLFWYSVNNIMTNFVIGGYKNYSKYPYTAIVDIYISNVTVKYMTYRS